MKFKIYLDDSEVGELVYDSEQSYFGYKINEIDWDSYEPLEFSEPTEEQRAENRALWEKHFGKFIADAFFEEVENGK